MRSRVMSSMTRCSASTSDASASRRARSSAKEGPGKRPETRASPVVSTAADLLPNADAASRGSTFDAVSNRDRNVELLIAGAKGSRRESDERPVRGRSAFAVGRVGSNGDTNGAARGRASPREPGRMSVRDSSRSSHSPEGPRGSPRRPSPRRARARAGPGASPRVGRGASSASTSRAGGRYSSDSAAYADESDPALAFASLGKDDPLDARARRGRRRVRDRGRRRDVPRQYGDAYIDVRFRRRRDHRGGRLRHSRGPRLRLVDGHRLLLGFLRARSFERLKLRPALRRRRGLTRHGAPGATRPPPARSPACAHPRAPPSAGGRSVVGPDDAVSCSSDFVVFVS